MGNHGKNFWKIEKELALDTIFFSTVPGMRDEYLKRAMVIIGNVNTLINLVSLRVKQLRSGKNKSLIQSLERLDLEDIALREIIEGKIYYKLCEQEDIHHGSWRNESTGG